MFNHCLAFLFVNLLLLVGCSQPISDNNSPQTNIAQEFVAPNSQQTNTGSTSARDLIQVESHSALETLGKLIFFDKNLSEPNGQSCGSCHSPLSGFADPDQNLPVSEGVLPNNFGGRNALSAGYVKFTPDFDIGATPMDAIGGLFWDGRKLNLEKQAKAPF